MPYLAPTIAPDGTYYEEEIPTPEEEAMLLSAGGYGPAPIPAPAAAPLAPAGTPPPPTQTLAYPTGDVAVPASGALTPAGGEAGYGQEVAATYGAYQPYAEPVPPPQDYNYGAAEPYGTGPYAINAGGDPNALRSQSAYSPPPLATVPRPAYNFSAAEPGPPSPVPDTAPFVGSPAEELATAPREVSQFGLGAIPRISGRILGLDPDDPNIDMLNQIQRNLSDMAINAGEAIAREVPETVGEHARRLGDQFGFTVNAVGNRVGPGTGFANELGDKLGDVWGGAEDVAGSFGMWPRRAQTRWFDPIGTKLQENIVEPVQERLARLDSPAWDEYQQLYDKFGQQRATTKDLLDVVNAPFATLDGQPPPPTGLSANAMGLGSRWGRAIHDDPAAAAASAAQAIEPIVEPAAEVVAPLPNLETMAAQELIAVARGEHAALNDPRVPVGVRDQLQAEAGRMIGRRAAAQVAQQDQPFYQGALDTVRGGLQAARGLDIPTPTLPAGRPTADFLSRAENLSGPDIPAIAANLVSRAENLPGPDIPLPTVSWPQEGIPAPESAAPVRDIPAATVAAARKNVLDPLLANSQDNTVFGLDTSGLSLPSIPRPSVSLPDASGVVDAVRDVAGGVAGAVGGAVGGVADAAAAPARETGAPPDMNAQVAGWLSRTTATDWDALRETDKDRWARTLKPVAMDIGGTRQKLVEAAPGYIVGYFDENGNVVHVDGDISAEAFEEQVIANAAEAPADWPPGRADAAPADTAGSGTPDVIVPVEADIPAPADTSTSSSRSSGSRSSGGNGSYDTGYEPRSSGNYGGDDGYQRGGSRGYEDYGDDFTADDFMEQAGGNRRKAEFMARAANKRRRRRGGSQMESGGMWPGFPFNRPPSPIRANVLASLEEAFAGAFPNRRR